MKCPWLVIIITSQNVRWLGTFQMPYGHMVIRTVTLCCRNHISPFGCIMFSLMCSNVTRKHKIDTHHISWTLHISFSWYFLSTFRMQVKQVSRWIVPLFNFKMMNWSLAFCLCSGLKISRERPFEALKSVFSFENSLDELFHYSI